MKRRERETCTLIIKADPITLMKNEIELRKIVSKDETRFITKEITDLVKQMC